MHFSHRSQGISLLSLSINSFLASGAAVLPRLDNGLARTPIMGWNSYNYYNCAPNETIAHSNAQAMIDLGLTDLGYHYFTIDCGWTLPNRSSDGTLPVNLDRFPSGYAALGTFLHKLGLGFGIYSDGGTQMCMSGEPAQVGSLYHETTDANTFASWGADLLKYDNCFSDAANGYPFVTYTPSVSPRENFVAMHDALKATGRPIVYQICEWGLDFPSAWAPAIGNSWRVTNDIIGAYRTIPRILNQIISQTSYAAPGQWLDLDMLEVGNGVFTTAEEQTHFSLWAIIKSPLVIGTVLKDSYKSISAASLAILKNKDVISYNQDSLGVAASFRRRWTEEGYEVWAGPLTHGRTVVAVVNLKDQARKLTLNFPDVGIQKASTLKDIWNGNIEKNVLTSYTASVEAHGTVLLELGGTTASGQYSASDASVSSQTTTFSKVFAVTTSSNYTLKITFKSAFKSLTTIAVNHKFYKVPTDRTTFTIPNLTLTSGSQNTIIITSPNSPASLQLSTAPPTFYPSTTFTSQGSSAHTTCSPDHCLPVGSKITNLSPSGSASASLTPPPNSLPGAKFLDLYFCNNDVAISTSWGSGTNTRNMTVSVNGVVTRVEVPLSGRSSELFSVGKGWEDTGVFGVLTQGWRDGVNKVVVGNEGGAGGLVAAGADFVGVGVHW